MTPLTPKEESRFWGKVRRAGSGDCWEWTACTTGAKDLGWYGRFHLRGRRYYSHRVAFCVARHLPMEYLSDTVSVMHTCDNPKCCNPAHLEVGTQLENIKDMIRKNRNRGRKKRKGSHEAQREQEGHPASGRSHAAA